MGQHVEKGCSCKIARRIIKSEAQKKRGTIIDTLKKHNEFKLRMERHLEIKFDVGTNEEIHAIELIL